MRNILFFLVVLVVAVSAPVYAADVDGNWTVSMAGRRGAETIDLVIKTGGDGLAISGTHSSLGDMEGSGTIKGNAIAMTLTSTGEMTLGYNLEGTVTGDKMAGTLEIDRSAVSEAAAGGTKGGDAAAGGTKGGDSAAGRTKGGDSAAGSTTAGEGKGNTGDSSNEWTAERK